MGVETTRAADREGPRPYSDDAQLADYLAVCWRYRWLIVLLTVLGGVVGLIVSRVLPLSYEAETVVAMVPPPPGQSAAMTIADVQTLFRSEEVAAKVVTAAGLERPPDSLTAHELVEDHIVVETVPGTSSLRLRVRLDRADHAARVANEVVRQGLSSSLETIRAQSLATRDRTRVAMDKAAARLDDALAHLRKSGSSLGLDDPEQLAVDRVKVEIDVRTQEAKIATLERELKRLQPASPAYDRLQYRLAIERSQLAAFTERQRLLTQPARSPHANGRSMSFSTQEAQLNIARTNYRAAQANYATLFARYQEAEFQAEDPDVPFQVVEEARPVAAPLPRETARLALIGVVLGMFAAISLALALDYYQLVSARTVVRTLSG